MTQYDAFFAILRHYILHFHLLLTVNLFWLRIFLVPWPATVGAKDNSSVARSRDSLTYATD